MGIISSRGVILSKVVSRELDILSFSFSVKNIPVDKSTHEIDCSPPTSFHEQRKLFVLSLK